MMGTLVIKALRHFLLGTYQEGILIPAFNETGAIGLRNKIVN